MTDETRALGAEIGFEMRTTPPYSPEGNGMTEPFVKSFQRDYVYLADFGPRPTGFMTTGSGPIRRNSRLRLIAASFGRGVARAKSRGSSKVAAASAHR